MEQKNRDEKLTSELSIGRTSLSDNARIPSIMKDQSGTTIVLSLDFYGPCVAIIYTSVLACNFLMIGDSLVGIEQAICASGQTSLNHSVVSGEKGRVQITANHIVDHVLPAVRRM